MEGQWREVVTLVFKGRHYRDHALDLRGLDKLGQFQIVVTETANALWRAANPDRERLPRGFEERTRLVLRRIGEGSTAVPLEVSIEEPDEPVLFGREPEEVKEAVALAQDVFYAAENDEQFPERFPRSLVSVYRKWGELLSEDESVEVRVEGRRPVAITQKSFVRLAAIEDTSYQSSMELTGEVLEADVRQGRFELWLDDKTKVGVRFSPDQEDNVTKALRDHRTIRLRMKGRGEFSPQGKPLQIAEVEECQLVPIGEIMYDTNARPIEEVLSELAEEVPKEEWQKLPADLNDNLDHYLYGTSRG